MLRRCLSLFAVLCSATILRAEGVSVELLEGTFKDKTWDLAPGKVTSTWTEGAFGFVAVPGKFSDKGLLLDRSNPFVVRAAQTITLPAGEYRILIRARGASRLYVDDKLILETAFLNKSPDGHGKVPPEPKVEPDLRYPPAGHQEKQTKLTLDGKPHHFRFEFFDGAKDLRPEVAGPAVATAPTGKPFRLLAADLRTPFSDEGWDRYTAESLAAHRKRNNAARMEAQADEFAYWQNRHDIARREWKNKPTIAVPNGDSQSPIDRFIGKALADARLTPAALADDDAFLRRVTLDTVGVIPSLEE